MIQYKEVTNEFEKSEITKEVLNELPDWFGIEESTRQYIEDSKELQFYAAYEESDNIGFITVKQHNVYSAEIYVMGVKQKYHGKGIGKELFKQVYMWCKKSHIEYLQVKTLDASHPDKNYAMTRKFYYAVGFRPLECFSTLWDEDNPCLVMVMKIF